MILSVEKQIYDTSQKPNKTSYQTAIEALQDAANAQDTADGKRRVFVTTPYPPYDEGDLWTDGTDLYVCQTARQSGSFASGDWVLATAYVTKSVVESDMEEAVQKISGNLGGYIILHDSDDDGYPDELLIMDTDDITTATNVWRWNQQGLMHANSYTGTYANAAITMDGKIVADAITTGTLRGIEIISTDGTNTVDIVNGRITTTGTGGGGGKTITTNYNYLLYNTNNALMANLTRSPMTDTGYQSGILTIDSTDALTQASLYANEATGGALRLRKGAVTGANLIADSGGGRLLLYTDDETNAVDLNAGQSTGTGGVFRLKWADGTSKVYLGTLTLTGLMTDEPALAFYDTSGNITSWYCGNRAYIKDHTSGEQGYVVHGHTYAHGISVDYTTSGRVDFYVDATYVGYATLSSSDKKTKKSIKPIAQKYKDAVGSVDLKSFRFNFKGEVLSEANDLLRFGAIAQDVIKALEDAGIDPAESELVDKVGEGKEERYAINYIPFLITRLAADEDRIQKLEEQNKALEERLARLEARIGD